MRFFIGSNTPTLQKSALNASGMSLVELMITMGVSMVLMMGALEYFRNVTSMQSDIASKAGVRSMVAEFSATVNASTDCDLLFPTLPVSGFDQAAATSADGTPIAIRMNDMNMSDGANMGSHLQIQSLRFQMPNPGSVFSTYNTAATSTYFGVIRLIPQKMMMTAGGGALRAQTLGQIALRVNDTNQIVRCVSLQSPEFRCITRVSAPNNWNTTTNTCY